MITERTPLQSAAQSNPNYLFMNNPHRAYRKKVRLFQCCICSTILIVVGLAVAMIFTGEFEDDSENVNTTSERTLLASYLPSFGPPESDSSPVAAQLNENEPTELPSEREFQDALQFGKAQLLIRDAMDEDNVPLPILSASYRHHQAMSTSLQAVRLARIGYAINKATENITRVHPNLQLFSIPNRIPINDEWLPTEWCDYYNFSHPLSKFRSIDGSWNNIHHPFMWGVAMRPFRRELKPEYCDGIFKPRCGSDKSPLPSAREVSIKVHRPFYRDDKKFSVMLAVWGQFIDHDITGTALSKGKDGKSLSCCNSESNQVHPECYPVYIDSDDPYYHKCNVTCMEFVRSAPSPTCTLGPREQINQVSNFLDGSTVYGNTFELAKSLRTFYGGKLRMSISPDGRPLLPISNNPNDGCNRKEENSRGRYCFQSGDARANENLHLTSLHLLLARHHNRIASYLSIVNPQWKDETLYQESRRIVSAQIQHITYNEFLRIILGPKMMEKLKLGPLKEGYYTGYSDEVDPSISNNFAAATFRFAHSLIPGLMRATANESDPEYIQLHKMLFNPYNLYSSAGLDNAIKSAMDTHLERVDSFFNKELTQHLFEENIAKCGKKMCGLDLVSLNIQRGRDHGLPGYPKWREYCGLSKPTSFNDLMGDIDNDTLEAMTEVYKSVEDIDLYTGATSENPIPGGMLGPTAMCLISDQFKRLKDGDRFWYETNERPQRFSKEQLEEIRKITLAKIICENSDDVNEVQPEVMKSTGEENALIPCSKLPQFDYTKWKSRK